MTMPRNIDADKLIEALQADCDREGVKADDMATSGYVDLSVKYNHGQYCYLKAIERVMEAPTADVVPKSEVDLYRKQVDELEDELAQSYDKLETAKTDVARELFEEIDNWFELYSEREYSFAEEETSKGHLPEAEAHDYALDIIKDLRQLCIAELEKKYIGGTNENQT